MAQRDLNGEWPELSVKIADLPKLEGRPSPLELAQAYATLAVHHGQLWPRVVDALEYLRGHLIGAKGEAASAKDEVRKLREELQGQRLGLPPMRPELPSTVDMAENIKTKISSEFEKIAKETQGPRVEADPKRLEAVVNKAVDEELAKREAARKAKADADELDARRQADIDKKKRNRKYIKIAVAAFVTSMAGGFGTWTWGKAQGHLEGHVEGRAEGFDEARKLVTVAASASGVPAMPAAPAAAKR